MIVDLQNFTQFSFAVNHISGTLPVGLAKMSTMNIIYGSNNLLSGTIPFEYGKYSYSTTLLVIFLIRIDYFSE